MRDDIQMKEYEEILEIITEFFGDESKAVLWMSSKNVLLGGVSPVEMILLGRSEKLQKWICVQMAENDAA